MNIGKMMVVAAVPALMVGCFSVKTESEIKPIHITLDVNLKVDKEIDKVIDDETKLKRNGRIAEVKDLLTRQVAGITNRAMLEARKTASDDDKITIAEANARRMARFTEIAKSSGVSLEAVQIRSRKRIEEHVQPGSGCWLQREDGSWFQK